MEITVDTLIREVQRRARTHGGMDQAYRSLAADIAEDMGLMTAWWGLFGPWWLQASYHVAQGNSLDSLSAMDSAPPDAPPPRAVARPERDWRRFLNPFDVILPVADTGRKKRVGDFDAEDAGAFEAMYQRQMRTAEKMRRRWSEVRETLGEGRLEDVRDRVPVLDLGLFPPQYVPQIRAANAGRPWATQPEGEDDAEG